MFLIERQREALIRAILDQGRFNTLFIGHLSAHQYLAFRKSLGATWLAILTTNANGRPDTVFVVATAKVANLEPVSPIWAVTEAEKWLRYRHIEEVAVSPGWCLGLPSVIKVLAEAEARVQRRAREATRQRYQPKRVAYGRS